MQLPERRQEDLLHEIEVLRARLRKYEPWEGDAASRPHLPEDKGLKVPFPLLPSIPRGTGMLAGYGPLEPGEGVRRQPLEAPVSELIRQLDADPGKFRALVDQAGEAIMITDAGGAGREPVIIYANRAFTRMTGYEEEEVLGKNPRILQGPATQAEARGKIREAFHRREPIRTEIINYRKDGTPYWSQLQICPIQDGQGGFTHFFSYARDITEERQVIEHLRLFATLIDQVEQGVLVSDTQFGEQNVPRIIYVNPAFCRMSGYSEEELIDQTPAIIGGEHYSPEMLARVRESLEQGESIQLQVQNTRKDGTDYWTDLRIAPLRTAEGQVTHFYSLHEDITEARNTMAALRRSEERLLEAQQIARVGSWEYNSASGAVWLSDELQHILGLAPGGEQNWGNLMDRLEVDPLFGSTNLIQMAEHDRLPDKVETSVRTGTGEIMPLLVRMWAERAQQGEGTRIYGTAQDITQQKRAEAALTEAKEAAERANRSKSLFLGVMSHELRTPLNSVIGLTDLLVQEEELTPRTREYLGLIHRASESLLAIIEDILTYAQSEPGQLRLKSEPLDLRELVEGVVSSLEPSFRGKRLEVTCVIDPQLPARLMGDRGRLRQIISNLVNNALKFTEAGGVICQVHYLPETSRVNVKITDSGEGIPAAFREHMFQPFSQADSSSTRRHGGSGLGLAICKRLLDLMGGTIELESTPGEGTTFTVDFPAVLVPAEVEERQADAGVALALDEKFARRYPHRILLVEDDSMNRRLIRVLLGRLGYEYQEASEGETALRLAREHPVDLILMDVQMPGISGLETSRLLRERAEDLPVPKPWIIALTANAMPGDRERCLEAGMNDYLSKPIRLAELAERLRNAPAMA